MTKKTTFFLSALLFTGIVAIATFCIDAKSYAETRDINRYASIGDSYSSGVGAQQYYPDSGDCLRSARAYAKIFARAHHINNSQHMSFSACSGATTYDIINNQLNFPVDTQLISLTAGGNDAGFSTVIKLCYILPEQACQAAVNASLQKVLWTLPGSYTNLLGQIKQKAPNAKIVVFGYPHLFVDGATICNDKLFGQSATKRAYLNGAADVLDNTIQQIVKDNSNRLSVRYVDTRSYFTGHEVCSNNPWIVDSNGDNMVEYYHPNAYGQIAYYSALTTGYKSLFFARR